MFFAFVVTIGAAHNSEAANNCSFATSGSVMALQSDCTTDATILVPDGMILDGGGFTLTAVDPAGGHFVGGVVKNGGSSASVANLTITTLNLANVCDGGDQRLRGILFQGASGVIAGNTVVNLNQGASGCQEGNAIEIRNFGDNPNTSVVEVAQNTLLSWQKTGVVANGNVNAYIHHNHIGGSATQANLAANSLQIGFGGKGLIEHNQVAGNSWCCADSAATAVLLFQSTSGTVVRQNNIMEGNADVGIYIDANGADVENNRVSETGADGFYDVGIGNYGTNRVYNNKVRGYLIVEDGNPTTKTKSIPSPQD